MRAIIFDIDGTLLRSSTQDDQLYRRAVEGVLGKVSYRPNIHDYDHVSDTGILRQVFEDNGVPLEAEVFDAVKNAFFASVREHIDRNGPFPEVPGAGEFLHRIDASSEHVFAIATGGWRESARIKLNAAGLPFEQAPLTSSDDAVERPDIMQLALDALDGVFESVTYYGDGPWDRDASERLGWSFVGVGEAIDGILSFHDEPLR